MSSAGLGTTEHQPSGPPHIAAPYRMATQCWTNPSTENPPDPPQTQCEMIAFVQTASTGGRGVSCHQVFHPPWHFLYRIATVKLGKMVRFNPLLCWGVPTQYQRLQFYRGPWRHRFYRDFMLNTALSTSQLRVLGTAILEWDMFSLDVYQSSEDWKKGNGWKQMETKWSRVTFKIFQAFFTSL